MASYISVISVTTIVVRFPTDCCIAKPWSSSSIIPYNNTSISHKHHTNIISTLFHEYINKYNHINTDWLTTLSSITTPLQVLLFGTLYFFQQFGVFMTTLMAFSLTLAFCFLMPVLATFGWVDRIIANAIHEQIDPIYKKYFEKKVDWAPLNINVRMYSYQYIYRVAASLYNTW